MHLLDAYSVKARLAPALIAILPVIALAVVAVPWNQFSVPQSAAASLVGILFIGASDLARRRGKRIERRILKANGGQPIATTLRHRDPIIDPVLKRRYVEWLGAQLNEAPPTCLDELENKTSADAFYSRCTVILRDRTRDAARFKLVFEENVTYGFRRNLLGLKRPTLLLDLIIALVGVATLWRGSDLAGEPTKPLAVAVVLAITALHGIYFLSMVTKASVLDASDQYGRQLVLSTETLISGGE